MFLKRWLIKACLLLSISLNSSNSTALPPGFYGTLGIIPGLGHVANGEILEGLGWFASSTLLMTVNNEAAVYAGFNLWQYNMFDAYKDAGAKTSPHSVYTHYLASWNPLNIWDPIGASVITVGAVAGAPSYPALLNPTKLIKYTFVGMGEESLFRGFLYPAFTNVLWDSHWMGAITSSFVFSAAHGVADPSALQPGPLAFRWLAGMIFCWQFSRNDYDLKKNIFAHSWYDIFVTNNDLRGNSKNAKTSTFELPDFKIRFQMPIN